MWEQLNVARSFRTDKIWILNVGDLKFLEVPLEWFMALAYDFEAWKEPSSLIRFLERWASREFGEEHAAEVGEIMALYSVGMRFRGERGLRDRFTRPGGKPSC